MEAGDIEIRSAKLKHGFLALQQLEGTLNMDEGGKLGTNMSHFYSMLRSQMMKAQIQQDREVLRELVPLLFSVREAWVEVNNRLAAPAEVAIEQSPMPAPKPSQEPGQIQTANWKA